MNIGIIGGGSIGLLLSSYLSKNHQVTLYVHRVEQMNKINEYGVTLFKNSKELPSVQIQARLMTELKEEDCYFVCVKQHHIESLLTLIKRVTKPIVFLQNGMGHLKYVKQLSTETYVGVVEHGASRMNDYQVNHLGDGVIKLAPIRRNLTKLADLIERLHRSDFPFKLEDDYHLLLKNKLIINAVINPLTAIFDIPNGSILTNEYIERLARKLCEEASFVLQLDETFSWERIVRTASITKNNTSSMRADIQRGRKTENEAISGYILEQKDDLPYTTFVYYSIQALEKEGSFSKWTSN